MNLQAMSETQLRILLIATPLVNEHYKEIISELQKRKFEAITEPVKIVTNGDYYERMQEQGHCDLPDTCEKCFQMREQSQNMPDDCYSDADSGL